MSDQYKIVIVYIAIAYIAGCNLIAAWLTWRIFGKLGWSPIAKSLSIGFISSAVAWAFFTSTEVTPLVPLDWIDEIVLAGLIVKSVGMTFIVGGMILWYRLTTRYKRRL